MEELLRRYPGTSNAETVEIRDFLIKGRILDIGIVTSNDELKAKVAALRRDHGEQFRLKGREVLTFYAITIAPMGLLVWYCISKGGS